MQQFKRNNHKRFLETQKLLLGPGSELSEYLQVVINDDRDMLDLLVDFLSQNYVKEQAEINEGNIDPWVNDKFEGRIELHKRAIKCLNDEPLYSDIELLCRAIEVLGTEYYDMKMGFHEDTTIFDQACYELKNRSVFHGQSAHFRYARSIIQD